MAIVIPLHNYTSFIVILLTTLRTFIFIIFTPLNPLIFIVFTPLHTFIVIVFAPFTQSQPIALVHLIMAGPGRHRQPPYWYSCQGMSGSTWTAILFVHLVMVCPVLHLQHNSIIPCWYLAYSSLPSL